jgi:hypothetical protein
MTMRAMLLGLLAVFFICGGGYINDRVLNLESISNGHQLPILVIGILMLVVSVVNPLLRRWRLRSAELALIVTLSACACGIPGRALMEHFAQIVVMPYHWERITPGWQSKNMLQYFPAGALVDPEPQDEVINRFVTGSDKALQPAASFREWLAVKLGQVPWQQWRPPLLTWLPLIFLTTIAMASMGLLVHRQWADHEHLQYPIADFTNAILTQDEGQAYNQLFRNKRFWLGFAIVLAIRLNNGLYQWFPDQLIPVKMTHSLWPFAAKWPALHRNPWAYGLMRIEFFPLVTAFAFFLSSEIAFTLGISQILWACFCIPVVGLGISMNTDYDIGGWQGWHRAGSYTAFTLMLLYSGRHYYLGVLKEALFLGKLSLRRQAATLSTAGRTAPGAATAMRILMLCCLGLFLLSLRLDLSWPIAIAVIALMLMTFLVVARISAETGMFFIQPGWQPFGALIALFGAFAIGPTAIVISALFCAVLCIDQCQALLPYLINGLKLGDKANIRPVVMTRAVLGSYLLGIIVALVTVIVVSYDFGTPVQYHWSYYRLPTLPFRAAEPVLLQLQATGTLEASEALSGWQRILAIKPSPAFLWAAGMGFGGVLLFSVLRLRLHSWPLHPCMFLIWATYPITVMSHAILLGWLIKKLCVRFGGNRLVLKLKPLAVGIIAADIVGALVFMIAGAIYFFVTGDQPKSYRYFPR